MPNKKKKNKYRRVASFSEAKYIQQEAQRIAREKIRASRASIGLTPDFEPLDDEDTNRGRVSASFVSETVGSRIRIAGAKSGARLSANPSNVSHTLDPSEIASSSSAAASREHLSTPASAPRKVSLIESVNAEYQDHRQNATRAHLPDPDNANSSVQWFGASRAVHPSEWDPEKPNRRSSVLLVLRFRLKP